jgi:MFS family permease
LGDAIGYKPVYLAGLTLFTVVSGFIGMSTSFPVMIALRALQGAGAAMISATSLALLAHGRLVSEYGESIASQGAMTYSGLALGSSLAFLNVLICGLVQLSGASQRATLLIQPSSR